MCNSSALHRQAIEYIIALWNVQIVLGAAEMLVIPRAKSVRNIYCYFYLYSTYF